MSAPTSLDASFVLVDAPASVSATSMPTTTSSTFAMSPSSQPASASVSTPNAPTHPSAEPSYTPGASGTSAHDWSFASIGPGGLCPDGAHFVDTYGRVCIPRGVNLSGNCKTPAKEDAEDWPSNYKTVTFVGRPFPLEDAPVHLSRLRRWGLTFVRFLITWEAVAPSGPDVLDTAYLSYLHALISLFPQYGITCFVSCHQDVWSRFSGGSGAPAWTLEAVGFDLGALEETGAAWLAGVRPGHEMAGERGVWPCGYQKLAAATMATCFWAGNTFAPKLRVDGKSAQDFLQDAFLAMWTAVAQKLGDLPAVCGFQMLNEPHRGYVGLQSLHEFVYETDLHLAHVPSAFESFTLGAGHPTRVAHWTRSFPFPTRRTSSAVLNSRKRKVWRVGGPTRGECVWAAHGVWAWDRVKDEPVVLREGYFRKDPQTGAEFDWYEHAYFPFVRRWADTVRAAAGPAGRDKMIFAEPIPNEFAPASWTAEKRPHGFVFAPHWYDLNALFTKSFGNFTVNVQDLSRGAFLFSTFYWGHTGARANYAKQIGAIADKARAALGPVPVLVGECGVPMDLNNGAAFRSGNFASQARMFDALIGALEKAMVGFTLWNYNPDNSDAAGDSWNAENFSWFSASRAAPRASLPATVAGDISQTESCLDDGARALGAIVRPYAAKIAGNPLRAVYDPLTGIFELVFVPMTGMGSPRESEVFIPDALVRGRALRVVGLDTAGGDTWTHDAARQTLFLLLAERAAPAEVHLRISLDPPPRAPFRLSAADSVNIWAGAALALVLALLTYWRSGAA